MRPFFALLFFACLTTAKEYREYGVAARDVLDKKLGGIFVDTKSREDHFADQKIARCNGDNDCCSEDNQCSMGEGDCDNDDQCIGDLKCKEDFCHQINAHIKSLNGGRLPRHLGKQELDFSESDDCCWWPDEVQDYINAMDAELGKKGGRWRRHQIYLEAMERGGKTD